MPQDLKKRLADLVRHALFHEQGHTVCPSGETRSQKGDGLVKLPTHAATQHTTGGDTARGKVWEKVVTQGSHRTSCC